MILALHGNVGSTKDFDLLFGEESILPVNLWSMAHLSLPEVAKELKKLVADNSENERGLLGYSMGGRIALQALGADPDFWDFAIIISAHPGLPNLNEREERKRRDQQWADLIRSDGWEAFLEQWNAQDVLADGMASLYQADLEVEKQNIATGFENWSTGCQEDLRPQLANYNGRVVWMVGERDEKFRRIGEEMAELMPNCRLVIVPDCGHRVIFSCPEAVKEQVARALL